MHIRLINYLGRIGKGSVIVRCIKMMTSTLIWTVNYLTSPRNKHISYQLNVESFKKISLGITTPACV
jgi:hypothetical protein